MKGGLLALFFLFSLFFPTPVSAHAFGVMYNLPIPIWLYLYGGGAAVIISFLIIGWFINQTKADLLYPTKDLSRQRFLAFLTSDSLRFFLQVLSLAIFVLTIVAGIVGDQEPLNNIAPLNFWIITLLGITYASALLGNIWQLISPFKILSKIIQQIFKQDRPLLKYPRSLGYFPALAIYFLLIWLELLSNGFAVNPHNLSEILIAYTFYTLLGAFVFGDEDWFRFGEFFGIFFGLISKVAPFEYRNKKLHLRPPFIGLIGESAKSFSLLMFILFMLSSTAFDGFHSTKTWLSFYFNKLGWVDHLLGKNAFLQAQTLFLFLSPLFFLALYLTAVFLMKILVKSSLSAKKLSLEFAYSLIPIALSYNVAHYYTLLLIQGQSVVSLMSDPLNLGWNLFGTISFTPNVGIVGANFVWHSQVAAIIIGHVAAVYLAHLTALRVFDSHRKALISQLPMLFLMVIYTITGLWILSLPLTLKG